MTEMQNNKFKQKKPKTDAVAEVTAQTAQTTKGADQKDAQVSAEAQVNTNTENTPTLSSQVCHDQNTVPVQLYFEGIGSLVELEVHSQVEYLHSAVEFPHECIRP